MTYFICRVSKQKKRRAFSFGEVLLSAFVLTSGLTATTALISSSLAYSYENRDVVIATQLAQEGVEMMRNLRDQNFAHQVDTGNYTDGEDGFKGFDELKRNCRIDNNTGLQCYTNQGSLVAQKYYLTTPVDPGLGDRFQHTGSANRFARYVYVEFNATNKTARIVSYAFWDWSNPFSMPSYVPSNGNISSCTLANKCVFSEVFLTKWGLL